MEFGSKHVYDYGGYSSCENSDEAEFIPAIRDMNSNNLNALSGHTGNLNANVARVQSPVLSNVTTDGNNSVPNPPPPPPVQGQPGAGGDDSRAKKKKRKTRKADTNVLSIKFACLADSAYTTTSQPIRCEHCGAIMSAHDSILNDFDSPDSEKSASLKWACAFCDHVNILTDEQSKQVRKNDLLFVPESEQNPEKEVKSGDDKVDLEKEAKVDAEDDSVLLFTLDISGSMGCSVCSKEEAGMSSNTRNIFDNANSNDDADSISSDDSIDSTQLGPRQIQSQQQPADDDDARPRRNSLTQRFMNLFNGNRRNSHSNSSMRNSISSNSNNISNVSQSNNFWPGTTRRGNRNRHMLTGRSNANRSIFGDASDSHYLSRLDLTKMAIDSQLGDLKKNKPNLKLGLVTFCTEVDYLADGEKNKQKHLPGSAINDRAAIQKEGMGCALPGPVAQSGEKLQRTIARMEPTSMTALGPALLMSVAIAGRQNQSKVIMCTDGCANVGVGRLDNGLARFSNTNEETASEENDFYEYVSQYANEFGVSVSVLAIEGTDCRLTALGKVADATNGAVNIVKPQDLGSEYSSIIDNKIVGSKVEVTIVMHKSLYVRNPLNSNDKTQSTYKLKLGNVTAETENFVEFGFKAKESETVAEKKEKMSRELPFQLQISYMNKHKANLTRVISHRMPFTTDRKVAEDDADIVLMAAHAVQNTANISKQKEYTKAKSEARSKIGFLNKIKVQRSTPGGAGFSEKESFAQMESENQLNEYMENLTRDQMTECATFGMNLSDVEDSGDEEASAPKAFSLFLGQQQSNSSSKRSRKIQMRMQSQTDASANMMYRNSKFSTNSILSKKK